MIMARPRVAMIFSRCVVVKNQDSTILSVWRPPTPLVRMYGQTFISRFGHDKHDQNSRRRSQECYSRVDNKYCTVDSVLINVYSEVKF